ncbi:hypothetical protein MLD38_001394 [Melastoma candidum]|uniref:Uncharacterized protein n=1 Tax=Melastoma candidum TaxID=119954 RepID=A0ACB9SLR3_9MYRT|nr:hypothetical protein MLD38_001394 [Melastoma candidum]
MPLFFFRSNNRPKPTMNPSKPKSRQTPATSSSAPCSRHGPRPRLDRRNAAKHFDYDASSSISGLDDSNSTNGSLLHTRSLDVDIEPQTSFRIEGSEGDIESIFKNLGLSGIDAFSIPVDAWESRKIRSVSDVLPRSQLTWADSFRDADVSEEKKERAGEEVVLRDELVGARVLTGLTGGRGSQPAERSSEVAVVELRSRVRDELGNGMNGIRGSRPPMLRPPPSMRLPAIDNTLSTWDLLRDFAPDENGDPDRRDDARFAPLSDEEEEIGSKVERIMAEREQDGGIRVGETRVLSPSCSSSISSDRDSSSSPYNVSPNASGMKIITYWEKGHLLGRGSFGSVYEGIADGGFFFAVKEVSLHDQGAKESILQLEREISLLSQFQHENIVRYYGTEKDELNLYIFLELVTKGSLLNLYHTYHLRDSQVSAYTRQILNGLKYLHDRDVVHRDIKCANILVDASGSVKLADFGLAKATRLNDVKSCKGTVFWMAPEVVRAKSNGYGLPADIWSLGCTVLEMLTRQLPYYPLELAQAVFRIGRGEPPPVSDTLSSDAKDFIMRCIRVNPEERPTAAELLEHPFVKRPPPVPSGPSSPYPGYLTRRQASRDTES